jgi:selenocysteine lyase/cysteine desulfurase
MVPDGLAYMNNGSYGPAPRVVFEALVRCLKQLEENPATFGDQYNRLVKVVKPKLAAFVGSDPAYTAFVTNLTFGMNMRNLLTLEALDSVWKITDPILQ